MMHKDVERHPEQPDKKDNNQLGNLGLCAPAIFLQKWDTTKQGEQSGQSGLVYHPTVLWLLEERFIQEKHILKETGGERRGKNELPIHLLLNNPC